MTSIEGQLHSSSVSGTLSGSHQQQDACSSTAAAQKTIAVPQHLSSSLAPLFHPTLDNSLTLKGSASKWSPFTATDCKRFESFLAAPIEIYTRDGAFSVAVSLKEILDELYHLSERSTDFQLGQVEIVGSAVRALLADLHFNERTLSDLGLPLAIRARYDLAAQLLRSQGRSYTDIDLRLSVFFGSHIKSDHAKAIVLRELGNLFTSAAVNCAKRRGCGDLNYERFRDQGFYKLKPVVSSKDRKCFLTLAIGNPKKKLVDIVFHHSSTERSHLFPLDNLRLRRHKEQQWHLLSDPSPCVPPLQAFVDWQLKVVRLVDLDSLDHYAWTAYLMKLVRGYAALGDPKGEALLMEKVTADYRGFKGQLQQAIRFHCQSHDEAIALTLQAMGCLGWGAAAESLWPCAATALQHKTQGVTPSSKALALLLADPGVPLTAISDLLQVLAALNLLERPSRTRLAPHLEGQALVLKLGRGHVHLRLELTGAIIRLIKSLPKHAAVGALLAHYLPRPQFNGHGRSPWLSVDGLTVPPAALNVLASATCRQGFPQLGIQLYLSANAISGSLLHNADIGRALAQCPGSPSIAALETLWGFELPKLRGAPKQPEEALVLDLAASPYREHAELALNVLNNSKNLSCMREAFDLLAQTHPGPAMRLFQQVVSSRTLGHQEQQELFLRGTSAVYAEWKQCGSREGLQVLIPTLSDLRKQLLKISRPRSISQLASGHLTALSWISHELHGEPKVFLDETVCHLLASKRNWKGLSHWLCSLEVPPAPNLKRFLSLMSYHNPAGTLKVLLKEEWIELLSAKEALDLALTLKRQRGSTEVWEALVQHSLKNDGRHPDKLLPYLGSLSPTLATDITFACCRSYHRKKPLATPPPEFFEAVRTYGNPRCMEELRLWSQFLFGKTDQASHSSAITLLLRLSEHLDFDVDAWTVLMKSCAAEASPELSAACLRALVKQRLPGPLPSAWPPLLWKLVHGSYSAASNLAPALLQGGNPLSDCVLQAPSLLLRERFLHRILGGDWSLLYRSEYHLGHCVQLFRDCSPNKVLALVIAAQGHAPLRLLLTKQLMAHGDAPSDGFPLTHEQAVELSSFLPQLKGNSRLRFQCFIYERILQGQHWDLIDKDLARDPQAYLRITLNFAKLCAKHLLVHLKRQHNADNQHSFHFLCQVMQQYRIQNEGIWQPFEALLNDDKLAESFFNLLETALNEGDLDFVKRGIHSLGVKHSSEALELLSLAGLPLSEEISALHHMASQGEVSSLLQQTLTGLGEKLFPHEDAVRDRLSQGLQPQDLYTLLKLQPWLPTPSVLTVLTVLTEIEIQKGQLSPPLLQLLEKLPSSDLLQRFAPQLLKGETLGLALDLLAATAPASSSFWERSVELAVEKASPTLSRRLLSLHLDQDISLWDQRGEGLLQLFSQLQQLPFELLGRLLERRAPRFPSAKEKELQWQFHALDLCCSYLKEQTRSAATISFATALFEYRCKLSSPPAAQKAELEAACSLRNFRLTDAILPHCNDDVLYRLAESWQAVEYPEDSVMDTKGITRALIKRGVHAANRQRNASLAGIVEKVALCSTLYPWQAADYLALVDPLTELYRMDLDIQFRLLDAAVTAMGSLNKDSLDALCERYRPLCSTIMTSCLGSPSKDLRQRAHQLFFTLYPIGDPCIRLLSPKVEGDYLEMVLDAALNDCDVDEIEGYISTFLKSASHGIRETSSLDGSCLAEDVAGSYPHYLATCFLCEAHPDPDVVKRIKDAYESCSTALETKPGFSLDDSSPLLSVWLEALRRITTGKLPAKHWAIFRKIGISTLHKLLKALPDMACSDFARLLLDFSVWELYNDVAEIGSREMKTLLHKAIEKGTFVNNTRECYILTVLLRDTNGASRLPLHMRHGALEQLMNNLLKVPSKKCMELASLTLAGEWLALARQVGSHKKGRALAERLFFQSTRDIVRKIIQLTPWPTKAEPTLPMPNLVPLMSAISAIMRLKCWQAKHQKLVEELMTELTTRMKQALADKSG